MAVNNYGLVTLNDFGAPKIITALAKDVISGGQSVLFSGADIVSSGADSFADGELFAEAGGSGLAFGGIAVQDVGSNTVGAFLIGNAVVIVEASGAVAVNQEVRAAGADYYVAAGSEANGNIGKAISSASAKGKWFLLDLK